MYGSKYDREYKVSEVLSAAIYLSEKAGKLVRDIREKGSTRVIVFLVSLNFILYHQNLSRKLRSLMTNF